MPDQPTPAPPDAALQQDPQQAVQPLTRPADGIPPVVEEERDLLRAAAAIAAGQGPVAIDAERASGYRYSQRAYLIQIRREGSGTWLIDPIAVPDLTPIQDAIGANEWVLHAATQDLPCLIDVGLKPAALFDTELGARLAGLDRVGLAASVQHYLGLSLAKEHSAVDWSTRPLPENWLNYAALDVEVLVALREAIAADLESQGKSEWARQEFHALLSFTGPPARSEPWRRVTGIHKVRGRRNLALVRELWQARDEIARKRDIATGRVIPDAMLIEIASAPTGSRDTVITRSTNRAVRRYEKQLLSALDAALTLPERELPHASVPAEGPPPPRAWADRDPVAAARLAAVRERYARLAELHNVPVENLLTPDTMRRALWTPPQTVTESAVAALLTDRGARPWQVELAAPILTEALQTITSAPTPVVPPDAGAAADAADAPSQAAAESPSSSHSADHEVTDQ